MPATPRAGATGWNGALLPPVASLLVTVGALAGCTLAGDGGGGASDDNNANDQGEALASEAVDIQSTETTATSSDPPASTTASDTNTTTAESTGPTTTTTTTTTTAEAGPAEIPAEMEAWLGTFQWVEFAEGDPGSDQTIVHELRLTGQAADGSLTGTFTETGFQTDVGMEVAAYPGETGITVFATTDGPPFYIADQRLFALSGDPDAPTTVLGAVQAFLSDSAPESGRYFTR